MNANEFKKKHGEATYEKVKSLVKKLADEGKSPEEIVRVVKTQFPGIDFPPEFNLVWCT